MQNPSVHWSEGMFLRPHHFQASDRYWTELASLGSQIDHPNGYGVYRLAVSEDGLSNGVLEISGLRARLRDGSILACESNDVLSVDLSKRLAPYNLGNQPVTAHLVVSRLQEGASNVREQGATTPARFEFFPREMADECTGGNRQEIELKRLCFDIKLSTEDLSGLEAIPILRLIRNTSNAAQFRIDPDYFPPSITTQSWPELAGLVRDIRNFIGSRIKLIGGIVQNRGINLSSQVQGDMEKMLLLHVLNEAYGELSCLAFASGVHPLVAYTSLCGIYGRCSIFGPTATIEELPQYDHDDLARIFRWIAEQIKRLINSVKEDEYVQRPFIGAGIHTMHVQLEPEWFSPEWDWYFGASPINFSVEECYKLLKDLDWKLGAGHLVETYMTNRQPGLRLRGIKDIPRVLANRGKWVLLQISLDDDPWKQVQLSQTLAMRVRSELVANSDSLNGNRRIHVTVGGQTFGLEFAIFAVKKRI